MPKPMVKSAGQPAGQVQAVQALSFVAGAHEHRELITSQGPFTLGAGVLSTTPNTLDVTAYGFIQSVILDVSWSGGAGGAFAADAPWNVLQNVFFRDVEGGYLQYPVDGYTLLEEQIYGGYDYRGDPRIDSTYNGNVDAGHFTVRIPVQVTRHNAFGALANQNAAATYKFGFELNTSANVYSTAPTTEPTWTVNAYLEAWTQPDSVSFTGVPQSQLPPLHGTTQYWTYDTKSVSAGNNVIPFTRVGNTIRTIVLIARDTTGARNDSVLPNPFSLNINGKVLTAESVTLRKTLMGQMLASGASVDVGVLAFYFNNSVLGKCGDESSELWLPTLQSNRLELVGQSQTAGTLEIVTNDISIVEIDQSQRYVFNSATGELQYPDLVGSTSAH
jgi:hypothetical protein